MAAFVCLCVCTWGDMRKLVEELDESSIVAGYFIAAALGELSSCCVY